MELSIEHHDALTEGPKVQVTELAPGVSFTVNDVQVSTAATTLAPEAHPIAELPAGANNLYGRNI
ncbi:MAG: hypothetical protein OXG34_06725 [bacterium]|nr:hypothetical protein [bacterium]MCY3889000.1 hypothetical protein [bacterium]MCY3961347.1 hypothetical protein [bacterium]MCY4133842.1 hypothetical protein [bacterium]